MNIRKMTNSIRWAFNFSKWNPTPSEMLLASSCVQKEEKERLARFVFKKDVKSSMIGCLMMRKYVNDVVHDNYNEIKFIRDEKGKPLLENPKACINFNVSHHGEYTVFVGEIRDLKLGVDVMKLEYSGGKTLNEFFRLMNRQFAPSEWETIRGAGDARQQTAMFCRHWCLKESYVKALGVGISVNLQQICFKINTKELTTKKVVHDTECFIRGEKLDWEFQESLLDDEHCVSVALSKSTEDKHLFKEINFDELMKNAVPVLVSDESFCKKYFTKMENPN